MKIQRIELRELRMPLVHFFETSFGRTTTRRIVLVRVDAEGVTGWGEVTAGEEPFYSYETPETAWHILRDFLVPWTLGRDWAAPADVAAAVSRRATAKRAVVEVARRHSGANSVRRFHRNPVVSGGTAGKDWARSGSRISTN